MDRLLHRQDNQRTRPIGRLASLFPPPPPKKIKNAYTHLQHSNSSSNSNKNDNSQAYLQGPSTDRRQLGVGRALLLPRRPGPRRRSPGTAPGADENADRVRRRSAIVVAGGGKISARKQIEQSSQAVLFSTRPVRLIHRSLIARVHVTPITRVFSGLVRVHSESLRESFVSKNTLAFYRPCSPERHFGPKQIPETRKEESLAGEQSQRR